MGRPITGKMLFYHLREILGTRIIRAILCLACGKAMYIRYLNEFNDAIIQGLFNEVPPEERGS
jgi:hypothetical protein